MGFKKHGARYLTGGNQLGSVVGELYYKEEKRYEWFIYSDNGKVYQLMRPVYGEFNEYYWKEIHTV